MFKVLVLVGTRPEIIKLSRILSELEKHVQVILVHTGQNYDYELNEIFFKELGIKKPNYFLSAAGKNAAETIGNVISKVDEVLEKEKPDAFLVYGDTNSCLGVISAKRRQVPIFHMEAGNRCFDLRVPEEINRKIVDHTSDINMVHSEHARRYLMDEGIGAETIIKTGSPMPEVLTFYQTAIDQSMALKNLAVTPNNYFVVSIHREENVDYPENFKMLIESLNKMAEIYQKTIIVSTHPRTQKKIDELKNVKISPLIKFLKPMGFYDYVKLQKHAFCVVSDSGTITEESSFLGFPALMIRQAHERPEGMDEGVVIMSGLQYENVCRSIDVVTKQKSANESCIQPIKDYSADNVSIKVLRIILSYTDYINREVWHKA